MGFSYQFSNQSRKNTFPNLAGIINSEIDFCEDNLKI